MKSVQALHALLVCPELGTLFNLTSYYHYSIAVRCDCLLWLSAVTYGCELSAVTVASDCLLWLQTTPGAWRRTSWRL